MEVLETRYMRNDFNSKRNALCKLMSMRKMDNESLQTFRDRVLSISRDELRAELTLEELQNI